MLAFKRAAVNEAQIEEMSRPTRPTKRAGNSHANGWPDGRPSVELDAIPPSALRDLVRLCVERHVSADDLDGLRRIEANERMQLQIFGQRFASTP